MFYIWMHVLIQALFVYYVDCAPDEFGCGNGHCAPLGKLCDGFNDCGDYSDECSCSEAVDYVQRYLGSCANEKIYGLDQTSEFMQFHR